MNEAQWLTCDHTAAMLIYLRGPGSAWERVASRGRLHSGAGELFDGTSPFIPAARFTRFVAACAARLRRVRLDEQVRRFLEVFHRHAEGETTFEEVLDCRASLPTEGARGVADGITLRGWETPLGAGSACWALAGNVARAVASQSIARTCGGATADDWFDWAFSGGPPDPLYQATLTAEGRAQADLLREVIGNPFRPVAIDPTWRLANDGAVMRVAQEISTEAAFDRMPILGDALLDAGCTDEQILGHCQVAAPHVRGCWALDLILGRS